MRICNRGSKVDYAVFYRDWGISHYKAHFGSARKCLGIYLINYFRTGGSRKSKKGGLIVAHERWHPLSSVKYQVLAAITFRYAI
jgi:hypothetical protein